MTQIEKGIIERIKQLGGIVVVTPHGLYTRGGSYLAFTTARNSARPQNARNAFLKKFCDPFTDEENAALHIRKTLRIAKYHRLITKALADRNYEAVEKLAQNVQFVSDRLFKNNYAYEIYYKLKAGI